MKTIWKFELATRDKQHLQMPADAEILTVQTQGDYPFLWAYVDSEADTTERSFEIFGTGHQIPVDMGIERKYIGTYKQDGGALVWHLFERIN